MALEARVNVINVNPVSRNSNSSGAIASDMVHTRLIVKIIGRYTRRFLIHCFGRVVMTRLIKVARTEVREVASLVLMFIINK